MKIRCKVVRTYGCIASTFPTIISYEMNIIKNFKLAKLNQSAFCSVKSEKYIEMVSRKTSQEKH